MGKGERMSYWKGGYHDEAYKYLDCRNPSDKRDTKLVRTFRHFVQQVCHYRNRAKEVKEWEKSQ